MTCTHELHTRALSLTHTAPCVCVCVLSLSLSLSLSESPRTHSPLTRKLATCPRASTHQVLALDTLVNEVVNAPLVCKAKHMECRMSVRQASRVGRRSVLTGRAPPSSSSLSSESALPSIAWAGLAASSKTVVGPAPLPTQRSCVEAAHTEESLRTRAAGDHTATRRPPEVAAATPDQSPMPTRRQFFLVGLVRGWPAAAQGAVPACQSDTRKSSRCASGMCRRASEWWRRLT